MNGHDPAALATSFRDLIADIGKPDTQPVDTGDGSFRLPNVSLNQILMGDPGFGANDQNAVDDHVVDCLCQLNRPDLSRLTAAFEDIVSTPPTSKQFVSLAMALDSHLGEPTRYYANVIESASDEWLAEFINRIGLEEIVIGMIAERQQC